MSESPFTSRERIIPIQIEENEDPINDVEKKVSECFLDNDVSITDDDDEEDNEEEDSEMPTSNKRLPMCNVKEKIILAIDSTEDENFTPFRLANGKQSKPLDTIKRAIELFLQSKHTMDKKHEYALVVLQENSVQWLHNFTSNINDIVNALHKIYPCEAEDIFDLNSLFNTILEKVIVPEVCETEGTIVPPAYVVRTVLVYGRSYTMPKLTRDENITELLQSAYFTLDVLMTHEVIDNTNNCNKIFKVLQNVDKKGISYFLPVGRNMKMLLNSVGMLLGHPLQRPPQYLAKYSIK